MKRFFSGTRLRAAAAFVFFLAALAGLIWHSGWGTASSFGIADIAAVCPLGALESMLAAKTFIPRAVAALVVFLMAAVLFGRFFCGWFCPVPWTGKLAARLRGRRKARNVEAGSARATTAAGVAPADDESIPCAACAEKSARTTGCAGCSAACIGKRGESLESIESSESSEKPGEAEEKIEKTPYVILGGALASSAVFGFPVFCLICPVGLTFALVIALWQLFEFNQTNWAILWFAGFLILELFVLRRWCGKFCPLGALMTLAARLNRTFRPLADPARCTRAAEGADCTICRTVCPEGIDPAKAKSNPWLLARCTKCGACAAACPSGAIHFPFLASSGAQKAARTVVPIVPNVSGAPAAAEAQSLGGSAGQGARRLDPAAVAQALARCVHCGECGEACPLGDRMPHATALLARGRRREAAEILLAAGSMPEITSRVCPTERFCEGACANEHGSRLSGHAAASGPVPIASLERTLAEEALEAGWRPTLRRTTHAGRVAVVGAGPAGLACADVLVRLGLEVHILDKARAAGGLLAFGIPSFKLPHDVVRRRVKLLEEAGAGFALGLEAGRDVAWQDLVAEFDAVFVGTGAGMPVALDVPGALTSDGRYGPGVSPAGEYLAAVARREIGCEDSREAMSDLKGCRVIVLGGGDTALDAARTALREGAASVLCVARRAEGALRARRADLAAAKAEGVSFRFESSAAALAREGDAERGRLLGVALKTPEGTVEEPADLVLVAYGFRGAADPGLEALGVRYDDRGAIATDAEGRTNAPKIWAGGDAVRGPALVSLALADGRRAGLAIAAALGVAV